LEWRFNHSSHSGTGVTGDEDKFLSAFNAEGSPSGFGFNWDPLAIGLGSAVPLKVTCADHWGECFGFGCGGCDFSGGVLFGGAVYLDRLQALQIFHDMRN
jgi:hypothetical protein